LALVAVSAVGGFFAPTLLWLQLFFAIEGGGTVMVGITSLTVIGESLPFNKKAKAVSYVVAAISLASLIGMIVIGFVANFGGWRSVLMFFVMPIAVASLIIASFALPSRTHKQQPAVRKETYLESFKQVLLNKSAFSCLISQLLSVAQIVGLYTIAFFQGQFSIPISSSIFIVMGSTSFMIVGSLVGGRIVNRFGRKRTTIIGSVLDGIFLVGVFLVPNLWVALAFNFAHVLFMAMAISAFNCLALDQVPQSRATMMSLTNVFGKIGNTIAAAVGGLVLFLFSSFQLLGLVFGAMTLATAAILSFLTKDPPRT
jgi:predicted MFS family arabinose efflux permease